MSKSNDNHNGKDCVEQENPRHDSNDDTMVSLEMMMAALRLVAEQRAAERNMRRQHEHEYVSGNVPSALRDRDRSSSINTVSSNTSTSTIRDASVQVAGESSSSNACAHEAEYGDFHYVDAEERPERNRDEAGPIAAVEQPPSTRWYCIVRGRAVGVFAGWPNTSPLVTNVPGSLFQRYPTFNAALNAFIEASANGHVIIIFI
ncbi:uncharacterized protein LAESUDRAFT_710641 [Laetiporus sulphureus 93-53]|uniref:Ribonuclease H1 N-terminal domain-containing protein n=1 Tax=Laetiporus sulphureus 93-53 TaxID=1314785 RepID=A0A165HUE2_9APHY|nr:uncharacterized protein LAESUDRAFT_710641 [Laetiporus sulphureus 93-53]KZT12200.1 hypothetical protein LAESUDRAFT_710641 [Laetiporus sulphureus 93-53]